MNTRTTSAAVLMILALAGAAGGQPTIEPMKGPPDLSKPGGGLPLPPPKPVDTTPRALTFSADRHDFGRVSDDASIPHSFKFKNTSDRTITINNVHPSCGCTSAPLTKKTYGPGEEGTIDITFNPTNRRGKEVKHITVDTDEPPSGKRYELTFDVEILPRVTMEPMSLTMGEIRFGKAGQMLLTVTGRGEAFDISEAKPKDPTFVIERGTREVTGEGDEKLVKLTYNVKVPENTKLGPYRSVLELKTTDAKRASVSVPLSADVVGDVRILPDRIPLRLGTPGEAWKRTLRLEARNGVKFEVLGLETEGITDLNLVVDMEPVPNTNGTAYHVFVSGTAPAQAGPITGKVIIRTDSKDLEEIIVPIVGNVVAAGAQPMPPPRALSRPQPQPQVPAPQPAPTVQPQPTQPANAPTPATPPGN
ncbi:MAG: DUF1573 domain-containing protein [Phycisphaerales bacterium]